MTQEDKELLLKDLSARLQYGVKIQTDYIDVKTLEGIQTPDYIGISDGYYSLDYMECKPYLFPLSSMTREQMMQSPSSVHICDLESLQIDGDWCDLNCRFSDLIDLINWLLKNHFDIYGLIPKGLAIDATELNIY